MEINTLEALMSKSNKPYLLRLKNQIIYFSTNLIKIQQKQHQVFDYDTSQPANLF